MGLVGHGSAGARAPKRVRENGSECMYGCVAVGTERNHMQCSIRARTLLVRSPHRPGEAQAHTAQQHGDTRACITPTRYVRPPQLCSRARGLLHLWHSTARRPARRGVMPRRAGAAGAPTRRGPLHPPPCRRVHTFARPTVGGRAPRPQRHTQHPNCLRTLLSQHLHTAVKSTRVWIPVILPL